MPGPAAIGHAQISACRVQMAQMAALWRDVAARSAPHPDAEAQVFNQMAVALAAWFLPRLRGVEGKDLTPMNEVRLLALGVTGNGGYFPADHTAPWRPEASVTGYRPGDRIALCEAAFSRLTAAYLDAITAKCAEA